MASAAHRKWKRVEKKSDKSIHKLMMRIAKLKDKTRAYYNKHKAKIEE